MSEPAHQESYDAGGVPLTDGGVLYTPTKAVSVDGETQWEREAPVDGSRLHPIIYRERIVSVGNDPELCWAIDTADGSDRWEAELSDRVSGLGATRHGGHAFFATATGIGAVGLDAQEEAWHTNLLDKYPFEQSSKWLSPAATDAHVFTINASYGHDQGQLLYALDSESGAVSWTTEIPGDPWGFRPPMIRDEHVYVVSYANDPPDVEETDHNWTQIAAIDPSDGDEAWRVAVPGPSQHQEAVGNGQLYLGHGGVKPDDPTTVSAIDTSDGSTAWSADLESQVVSITCTHQTAYVLDSHYLHAFEHGGEERWSIDLVNVLDGIESKGDLAGLPAPPVVDDGRLFLHHGQGKVAGLW